MPTTIDPDRLAELEEERRFLLRSLADLEREREAGDVDDADYRVLRDGYTARAAAVLRAIEDGSAAVAARGPRRPGRVAMWVLLTLAVATLAGWLVARSSGQRLAGQTVTGGQEVEGVAASLAEARLFLAQGDYAAAAGAFRLVLDEEPSNVEARTYTAWLLVLSSPGASPDVREVALERATADFRAVIADDPDYADARCLYAVTLGRFLTEPDLEAARAEARRCLDTDPPVGMAQLVESFLASLDAAGSTTSTGVAGPTTTLG